MIAAFTAAVGLAASFVPARRAARMDPLSRAFGTPGGNVDLSPCESGAARDPPGVRSSFAIGAKQIWTKNCATTSTAKRASGRQRPRPRRGRVRARGIRSVEMIKEEARDARGITFVDHLRRDTRHGGVRRLARDWKFTLAAAVILGLGIGVNTAVFSVINAVLFRAQAILNPDTLVDIYQNAPGGAPTGSSYPAYLDMADIPTSLPARLSRSFRIRSRLRTVVRRQAIAENVPASYLAVLGLRPALGRWFYRERGRVECAAGRCHRSSGVDDAVCLRSGRRGPHHPHRGDAGDGGGRRPGESRGVDESSARIPTSGCRQDAADVRRFSSNVRAQRRPGRLHGHGAAAARRHVAARRPR